MKKLILILGICIAFPLRVKTMQLCWQWFVVPTIYLAPISFWNMAGLNVLMDLIMFRPVAGRETKGTEADGWARLIESFLFTALGAGLGVLFHQFAK